MLRLTSIFIALLMGLLALSSCSKNDDDAIPDNQDIVTSDTTLVTGELTVVTNYFHNGDVIKAPTGTVVELFATYEDLRNGFDIYDLSSTGNTTYFGFINYGTYYVSAYATIGGLDYTAENAVQVRPNRSETLTITMLPK
jgi:hypothetical protein